MDPQKAPLSQLFAYVKQVHGLSNRKIAEQLGRSETLVRKILAGTRRGFWSQFRKRR